MNYDKEIEQFVKEMRLRWYRYSTIVVYRSCVTSFLYKLNKPTSEISIEDIKDYLLTFDNRSTHKQNNGTIHLFFETVLKKKLSLQDLPYPKPSFYLPNILSPEEILMVCRSIHLLKQRVAIQTTYSCGLRISELLNLKIEDINFYNSTLKVCDSKGAKDRYIPIPLGTMNLIKKYIAKDSPKVFLLNGWLDEPQYSEASIRAILKKALKKCGIKRRIRIHDLRHSRLSHLADKKVGWNYLKEFSGHSDLRTLLTYTHTSTESMQEQIAGADNMIYNSIHQNKLSQTIPV